MEAIPTWEKILAGIVVVLVLLWLRPGIKASLQNSRKGSRGDWLGLLFPIGLVILFVLLLISMVAR
jgi:hypothetical protein